MANPLEILVSKTGGRKRLYAFDMNTQGTASLQFENWMCSKALGTINGKEFKFERKGFWKKNLDVTGQQSPYTKTHIEISWRQKLEVRGEDNNMYYLRHIGWWRRKWGWFNSAGQQLLEIRSNRLSRKRRGTITIFQPSRQELYWLMLVGWFQVVIWEDQTAAAVAAT